jgi:CTP:molybdopterin cytidylyltransferase MocA
MGRPKLLLPLGEGTVISRLLAVLRRPGIIETVVVVAPGDQTLKAAVTSGGAIALEPESRPAEMRQSVEAALRFIQFRHAPHADDGWILIPADHPLLDPAVLDELTAQYWQTGAKILVPTHRGQRGHPTIFRWSLAAAVFDLPADAGLNQLVRDNAEAVLEFETGSPAVLADLDTPDDYGKLVASITR